MSQRDSGYERKERDLYETPAWVTEALFDGHMRPSDVIWEPAAGGGKMAAAIDRCGGHQVIATDIDTGTDFFAAALPHPKVTAIITNPPYALAEEFINCALDFMRPRAGQVAMLLRTDYDHAVTRQYLFSGCQSFARKLVLTKRIKWFEDSNGSPSFNHAWFIWDATHSGAPTLAYGPVR